MNYEIVQLQQKTVAGISARTSNSDENMPATIGSLWGSFYQNGIYESIPNKVNDTSIGLYSDYESDVNGEYSITVCCPINSLEGLPDNVVVKHITEGKYAKFVVRGHMQTAVNEFWTQFWTMDIDRNYNGDFEEYQSGGTMEDCEIHVYISIN